LAVLKFIIETCKQSPDMKTKSGSTPMYIAAQVKNKTKKKMKERERK